MKTCCLVRFHSLCLITILLLLSATAASGSGLRESTAQAGFASQEKREKYALLVGIQKYHRGSDKPDFDWWNLNTKGDIEIIAHQLITKFQFKPENIKVLCDEPVTIGDKTIPAALNGGVTRAMITKTFREDITRRVKAGDIVYFHFSGHGQQIPDDNGDELDGYDETLIPSDYLSQQDGSKNLRDDEIAVLLEELSRKNPSNVTVTIDSCFSGTATRGDLPSRGGEWKGKRIEPNKIKGADHNAADFVTRGLSRGNLPNEQKYVFLSAASPRQTAKETWENNQAYGVFSFALAKAMERAGEDTTYRDLFNNVMNAVSAKQRDQMPQMEGNQIDKILMEEGALPPQRFVAVKKTKNGAPYLAAGRLQGMTKGSKFALYPAETKEHIAGKEIAVAEITSVNPTSSAVKIEGNAAPEKLAEAARAFEISHNYEDVLRIAVQEPSRSFKVESVLSQIGLASTVPFADTSWNVLIRSAEESDERFNIKDVNNNTVRKDFRGILLQRRDGTVIAAVPEGLNTNKLVQEKLLAESRWLTVKSLAETGDPALQKAVSLEMIPVTILESETGESLGITEKKGGFALENGKIKLVAGEDAVKLRIKNSSDKPLYVTILNLRPDGVIAPAFPVNSSDNRIEAGKSYDIPLPFLISEPLGQESFVAIATETPTDFTPLVDQDLLKRGEPASSAGRNAANSPLGRILKTAATGKRSAEIGTAPASWATTSVNYLVVAPKAN
jgi:metacaspase-1